MNEFLEKIKTGQIKKTISRKGEFTKVYETERGKENMFPVFREFKLNDFRTAYIIADERTIIQFLFKYNHLNNLVYSTMNINWQVKYEDFADVFEKDIITQEYFNENYLIPFAETTETINKVLNENKTD